MAAIYSNFKQGTLSVAAGGLVGNTTLTSSAFANLPLVQTPDVLYLVLDPGQVAGAAEVVMVTTHSPANSTTVTVVRAQQDTAVRQHAVGTVWSHAWTKADADLLPHRVLTTKGDLLVGTGSNNISRLPLGTNTYALVADSAQTLGVKWAPAASSVSSLTDVTLTSLGNGQYLRYDGTAWVNTTDGSTFTALNATNLGSGTVPSARVSGAYGNITGLGTLTGLTVSGTITLTGSMNASSGIMTANMTSGQVANATGGTAPLQVFQASTTSGDAYMTFHNSNRFACYFGLDATSNNLFVGGWSYGAGKYFILFGNSSGTGTAQPRSVIASTGAPTGGSSGDIWVRHAA